VLSAKHRFDSTLARRPLWGAEVQSSLKLNAPASFDVYPLVATAGHHVKSLASTPEARSKESHVLQHCQCVNLRSRFLVVQATASQLQSLYESDLERSATVETSCSVKQTTASRSQRASRRVYTHYHAQ
jgi:hypothetical protein